MYVAKTKMLISFVHIFKKQVSNEAVQIVFEKLEEEQFDKDY